MQLRLRSLGLACVVGVMLAPTACGGSDSAEDQGSGGVGGVDGGTGGTGGSAASGGSGGTAGDAGTGGLGGSAGDAGSSGAAGQAGGGGASGAAGQAGSGAAAGQAGSGAAAGAAGSGGPVCGDGQVEPPEACDDDGTEPDDGCSAECEVETGWTCDEAQPSVCEPICGDGLLVPTEPCDGELFGTADCVSLGFDGGVLACDACTFDTSGCTTCGDGICDPGELVTCPSDCEAVDVSAGENHTCAVGGAGVAWCWGDNTSGKLGDGTTDPRTSPVDVEQLTGVVDVTAGYGEHSCAVLDDGTVWCWGENTWGQLGDGSFDPSPTPVQVPGVVGALTVCAGVVHTCALLSSGRVACWGRHEQGQLGNSAVHQNCTGDMDCSPNPVFVDYMVSTTQLDCGRYHSCLVKNGGEVFCWGGNDYGQLGVGDTSFRDAPDRVLNIDDGTAIGVGLESACLIRSDSTGWCWGKNDVAQLGSGTASPFEMLPVQVVGLTSTWKFGPGLDHTCALLQDHSAWCWGADGSGQLGNGPAGDSTQIGAVGGSADTAAIIDGGASHTCAVKHDGTLWCWGGNGAGQLGNASTDPAALPQQIHLQ